MEKKKSKAVFKPYNQHQLLLLPPSLESLIEAHHPVRVVNQVIDRLDLSSIESQYKGGGTSSYHPKMLLKVLIYGYLRNIYSSRKLEQALKENIHFMWLGGMARPDHSTINNFRSERLKDSIKDIFTQVVLLLVEEGLVDIKTLYVDGTKIEANANRYTFVWARAIATNKEKIKERLAVLWDYVEQVYQNEQTQPVRPDFKALSAEKVEQTVEQIQAALKDKVVDPEIKKKLKYAQKNYPNKLREYAQKEAQLAGRNSLSKTDIDATFMRTKDDHFKNGQLKPCYNVQWSTSNQAVVNYTIGQSSTDTGLLIGHLEDYQQQFGHPPATVVADAGYGSEENYTAMAQQGIEAYVKYNYFHKEQKPSFLHDPSKRDNLYYNEAQDCYYCPMGQRMERCGERSYQTKTGYVQHVSVYQAKNCAGCPMRGSCHRSKKERQVHRNHSLEEYKAKVRARLKSPEGKFHRGQRCADVEAAFGQLKANKAFRRFSLRGLSKVNIELGLLGLSMNLSKLASHQQKMLAKSSGMGGVCPETSKNSPSAPLEKKRA